MIPTKPHPIHPLYLAQAHIFKLPDPIQSPREWILQEQGFVPISIVHDTSRELYRIISVDLNCKNITVNSTIDPSLEVKRSGDSFIHFKDNGEVYGIGFLSEYESDSFIEWVERAKWRPPTVAVTHNEVNYHYQPSWGSYPYLNQLQDKIALTEPSKPSSIDCAIQCDLNPQLTSRVSHPILTQQTQPTHLITQVPPSFSDTPPLTPLQSALETNKKLTQLQSEGNAHLLQWKALITKTQSKQANLIETLETLKSSQKALNSQSILYDQVIAKWKEHISTTKDKIKTVSRAKEELLVLSGDVMKLRGRVEEMEEKVKLARVKRDGVLEERKGREKIAEMEEVYRGLIRDINKLGF